MSDAKQDDDVRGGRFLLGRKYVTVHHGKLRIDAEIAKILKLMENQVLPERVDTDEDDLPRDPSARPLVVLTPIIRVRPSRKWLFCLAAVVAGFVLLWTFQVQRFWSQKEVRAIPVVVPTSISTDPAPAKPRRSKPPSVHVRRDSQGVPIAISGPDAVGVLAKFCEVADPSLGRTPIGIAPAPPHGSGMVLGHFQDHGVSEQHLAILIYFDPRTSRWRVGDGTRPIEPTPVAAGGSR